MCRKVSYVKYRIVCSDKVTTFCYNDNLKDSDLIYLPIYSLLLILSMYGCSFDTCGLPHICGPNRNQEKFWNLVYYVQWASFDVDAHCKKWEKEREPSKKAKNNTKTKAKGGEQSPLETKVR